MTFYELYRWAKEEIYLNCQVKILFKNGGGIEPEIVQVAKNRKIVLHENIFNSKSMTVAELYAWAKENNCTNNKINILTCDNIDVFPSPENTEDDTVVVLHKIGFRM